MTAATLDTLSGGRFRLGLGVSGPQVSEGWHGVRFDKPLARTREYSDIVKLALTPAEGPVRGPALRPAAARRPRQGAAADRAPGPRAHPDVPRRGRPEEPRAVRRAVRRLAGDLLLARPRQGPARGDRRPAGPRSGKTLDGLRRRPDHADRRRRRPARLRRPGPLVRRAVRRRDGQPGEELLQPLAVADGLRGGGQEQVQDLYLSRDYAGARGRGAVRVPRPDRRCSAAKERIADKMQALAEQRRHDADAVAVRGAAGGAGRPACGPPSRRCERSGVGS